MQDSGHCLFGVVSESVATFLCNVWNSVSEMLFYYYDFSLVYLIHCIKGSTLTLIRGKVYVMLTVTNQIYSHLSRG